MTGPERAIRWSTIAAVTGVAVIAGWVSYEHALAVVRAHGEGGTVARLYPGTVDGLIYSASMVLLDAARRKAPAPPLARWLLAAGIGATLAANVAAGLASGIVGAIVAAWPALALVGSYELLMLIIRSGVPDSAPGVPDGTVGTESDGQSVPVVYPDDPETGEPLDGLESLRAWLTGEAVPVPAVPAALNGHGHAAVELFAADLAAGQVPGIRAIKAGLGVGQPIAQQVQVYLRTLARTSGVNGND